ncbi:MAG: XRE family transcriptional regulator [Hyphomonadaceae bacterium]
MKVPVNGAVLRWARELRELTISEAATKLDWPEKDLREYEDGRPEMTLGDLERISSKYEIPVASLLMPEPLPKVQKQIPDFRTHEGEEASYSAKLQAVIEEVDDTIELLVDLREQAPDLFKSLMDLPRIKLEDDTQRVAEKERNRIGPAVEIQLAWEKRRQAFLWFRGMIEGEGVFVYVVNTGDEDNCRGFSITDNRQLPFIVVNGDDEDYGPKLFSLLHEYAHILLRMGGLSDHNRGNRVERFCNQFAADFLMPRKAFKDEVKRLGRGPIGDWHLGQLAGAFHVSKSAVALHLETCEMVPEGFYDRWKASLPRIAKKKRKGGSATHVEKLANRLGTRLLSVIEAGQSRGLVNKADIFDITRAKPEYLADLTTEVGARRKRYGG